MGKCTSVSPYDWLPCLCEPAFLFTSLASTAHFLWVTAEMLYQKIKCCWIECRSEVQMLKVTLCTYWFNFYVITLNLQFHGVFFSYFLYSGQHTVCIFKKKKTFACYLYTAHVKCTHLLHEVDGSLKLQHHVWEYLKRACLPKTWLL